MQSNSIAVIVAVMVIAAAGFFLYNSLNLGGSTIIPGDSQTSTTETTETTAAEPTETPTTLDQANTPLGDMQIAACNAADKANTCKTRLAKLGVVTTEECCKYLQKCC